MSASDNQPSNLMSLLRGTRLDGTPTQDIMDQAANEIERLRVVIARIGLLTKTLSDWDDEEALEDIARIVKNEIANAGDAFCYHDYVCLVGGLRCVKCGEQIAGRILIESPAETPGDSGG